MPTQIWRLWKPPPAPFLFICWVRGGHPTRIDGLLVDTCVAALLYSLEVLPACGILQHRPVCFDVLCEGVGHSVVKLVCLPQVVIPPMLEEQLVLLDTLGPCWHAELATGDLDPPR